MCMKKRETILNTHLKIYLRFHILSIHDFISAAIISMVLNFGLQGYEEQIVKGYKFYDPTYLTLSVPFRSDGLLDESTSLLLPIESESLLISSSSF